jgi:hypothetical protein
MEMDFLNNPLIKQKLMAQPFFDLSYNNQRLNVILPLEDEPVKELEKIFNKIIHDDKIENNYYELNNLFTLAQMVEQNIVTNLIIKTVNTKILSIQDTIFSDNGKLDEINLGMYIQLWKSYKDFCTKMYLLIKNYHQYLVDMNIQIGKIHHNIMSIIQMCMFYNSIINKQDNENILHIVSKDLANIDKKNIEQLIDYIDSIRAFIIMKDFTNVDRDKLSNIIRAIMGKTTIVNIMCEHMHHLLKSLSNNQPIVDESEYETVVANDAEKKTIKKIYKIATILSTYSDKLKLVTCYSKFMQSRIIDLKYDNLELEIEIVRRISGALGKEDAQKMIDAIADILNTKNANQVIQSADIKVKSDEYKKLTNISTKILAPIVLTKNIWKIYNITELEPAYPLEMKCYLDIISKSYLSIYRGDYIINWQPTMGSAQFTAHLGQKKIDITCNILQSMALLYLNDNIETTSSKFAKDVLINTELSSKIFESLFEANIIIYLHIDHIEDPVYIINLQNYMGDAKIDIRPIFVDVFKVETEVNSKKSKKNNDADDIIDIIDEKNISYNNFISSQIKKLRENIPDLTNSEYMGLAAEEWAKYPSKKAVAKKAVAKTVAKKAVAKKSKAKEPMPEYNPDE